MLSRIFRLFFAILMAAAIFSPAQADIVIHLRDGRSITLPLAPDEVSSISFGKDSAAGGSHTQPGPAATAPSAGAIIRDGKRVLLVGPLRELKRPSDAARIARNGDIVEIDAGDYLGDVATWRQSDLTIRGVGGRPHIEAAGRIAEGKAIWVIKGMNTRIENVELSGAQAFDQNGAGIRQEGANLTLDHCYIHGNEMGLLTNANPSNNVVIRNSEFADNWVRKQGARHIGHNIYVGAAQSFTLENSYVHDAHVGHNVKSRAARNVIQKNRIQDGEHGSASYLLDLPAGGIALVQGNYFQKGQDAENRASISYGAEKELYEKNSLTVRGNRFVNDHWAGIFVDNHAGIDAKITQNRFKGAGAILRGSGTVSDNLEEK